MRKKHSVKRPITPDARHNSELLTRMINMIMYSGKKSTAQGLVYSALDQVKEKLKETDPLEVFIQALENCKPQVQVKTRRVGGANYQVPVEVAPERQTSLAMRWIINYARAKKGRPFADALATELVDAFNNTGNAVKKKEDTHKMAAANKAFAHYRW